eukprot:TRINITY_DN2722_c0_g1_i2.p1 TRINITY_DN2722_c0_g1~~TRINITY_DN2722_c0_g1_i2.p1  ORF type:complete len:111 (-),score=52.66 TRINITY_DN2722_c0_g1_i2:273-605(-)
MCIRDRPAEDPELYSSRGEEKYVTEVLPAREHIVEQATQVALEKFDMLLAPEEHERRVNDLWQAMDLNHDGQVSKDEFVGMYLTHQIKVQMQETYATLGIDLSEVEEQET